MAAHHTGEPQGNGNSWSFFLLKATLIKTGNTSEIFESCHKTHGISSKFYMFYFWGVFFVFEKNLREVA